MARVRAHLIQRAEENVVSLTHAHTDAYDFTSERDRQLERLADLRSGKPVNAYGWELPREARPANRARLYTVTATGIVPAVVSQF